MADSTEKKCTRNGCKKKYTDAENTPGACNYHPGKPIFHDLKKGWTCCNKIVYDWDEFQKIPTCASGLHTDSTDSTTDEFFKSGTVDNARKALEREENRVEVKRIEDFNKEEEARQKIIDEEEAKKLKKPIVTPSGKYKCANKGCLKEYDPNENGPSACNYHPGEPCFHDLKKFWSCCKTTVWDWDEFMKLPTCQTGEHVPKLQ